MTEEIVGRLSGVYAEVGTVIGYSRRHERFVSVAQIGQGHVLLRFSTSVEVNRIGIWEPRSVAEHRGISQRMTPYGLARMFGPRPYVKPKVITPAKARKLARNFKTQYPRLIRTWENYGHGQHHNR